MNNKDTHLNAFGFLTRLFFLSGIFTLFAQIILIREFVSVFLGNELVIAVATAFWMTANFLGNRIAATFPVKNITLFIAVLLNAIAALPCMLIILKFMTFSFVSTGGMLLPLKTIIYASMLVVMPTGILSGFLFTIGCSIVVEGKPFDTLRFYRFETLGYVAGGFLFTFWVSSRFSNFESALYLTYALTSIISVMSFIYFYKSPIRFMFLLLPLLLLFVPDGDFMKKYENLNFRGEELIKTIPGIYGKMQITKSGSQSNFYLNNFYMGCTKDLIESQKNSHIPLCATPNKTKLLYIGNIYNETLAEIVSHDEVKEIYATTTDSSTLTDIRPFLNQRQQNALKNPKVTIPKKEARHFIEKTKQKFSAVIINAKKPQNGIANRFYTYEFFKKLAEKMTDDAVLVITLEQNPNYVSEADCFLLAGISRTLNKVFPYTRNYLSDMTLMTAAKNDILISDPKEAALSLKGADFEKGYINEKLIEIIFSRKAEENFTDNIIRNVSSPSTNYDLKPLAYYYGIMKQSALFENTFFIKMLKNTNTVTYIFAGVFFTLWFFPRKKKDFTGTLFYSMATISFSCMLLLMCLIYSLHAYYGNAYMQISLMTALFMAGLYRGATYAEIAKNLKNQNVLSFFIRLLSVQIILLIFTLILIIIFYIFNKYNLPKSAHSILWFLLSFYTGHFTGYGFGLIKHILENLGEKPASTAKLYAYDILGGSLSAFLCGTVFMAKLGIFRTCAIAISLVFLSVIFSFSGYKYLKNS